MPGTFTLKCFLNSASATALVAAFAVTAVGAAVQSSAPVQVPAQTSYVVDVQVIFRTSVHGGEITSAEIGDVI